MKLIRWNDPYFESQLKEMVGTSTLFDKTIEERTRAIIADVYTRSDAALLELTERFDGARLSREDMAVTKAEFLGASLAADEELRKAVDTASANIEFFAKKSLRKNWSAKNKQGGTVGEKFDPFGRVGIYIPGGTAPLASTALMTITLARVAGCPEIVVCTPPDREGHINPALLFAARSAGATEIYKVGGAQAIAAMALGTASIRHVQKIFGPGNAYVVMAKRLLFGHVAIDLLPGPSEVLVLADDSANASFAAADLLAQAEHGSGDGRLWLVSPSMKMIRAVESEIQKQLPKLQRREAIATCLRENAWSVLVKDVNQGVNVVNAIGPEHCEVMFKNGAKVAEGIKTAGAIFIGPYSPTVLGDYMAGPSHTLPTGGAGLSFAGLTVDQFQRRTSVVEYGAGSLKKSLKTIQKFAELEGLDAHGRSATIRVDKKKS